MLNQIPLESRPNGTVVKTTALVGGLPFDHYGVLDRAWNGQVLIHHNSKKIGHAATTDLDGFREGSQVSAHFVPQTLAEGWSIAKRARAEVARGVRWTIDDNCEDFVSRAISGQRGSPTRSLFVGLALFGLAVWILPKL